VASGDHPLSFEADIKPLFRVCESISFAFERWATTAMPA
jgi:hypothetical protein